MWQEILQVLRAMRKSPGYVAFAALMLGLGLGVNATLFTLINTILFKPLGGVNRAESLVLIGRTDKGIGFDSLSYPNFVDLRDQNTTLADIAAHRQMQSSIAVDKQSQVVASEMVSWNYFRALETPLAAGRFFRKGDDTVGTSELTAVISERLWQRLWQRSPEAMGAHVIINGHPFTIIGVAGAGFRGAVLPTEVDLWIPWAFAPVFSPESDLLNSRASNTFRAVARLKPGVSEAEAQANLSAIASQLEKAYPDVNKDKGVRVWAYHPFPTPMGFRNAGQFLSILIGVSVLVLVVVCANLSNLMLARANARQREIAIRSALGASKMRLLRLMLIEGTVLATLGLLASLTLSAWAGTFLINIIPGEDSAPLNLSATPDLTVALAAAALALFCTLLFAALPAWQGSRVDLVPALRSGEIAVTPRRSRIRTATLVVQVALCVLLLVAAGLLMRSIDRLRNVDPGLNVDRLLLAQLDLNLNGYDTPRAREFYTRLQERLALLPGVRSASLARVVPLGSMGMGLGGVYGGAVSKEMPLGPDCNIIGLNYFETMGIALKQGRDFLPLDAGESRRVVIVNETLAKRMWPAGDALGKLLYLKDDEEKPFEIVGVSANIHYRGIQDTDRPFFYLPLAQYDATSQTIHLRTEKDPLTAISQVRNVIRSMDPGLALGRVDTMRHQLENSFWIQRLAGIMVASCGLLGVLIAMLGLYGVISFEVTRQTREIGVRMALGATGADVLQRIVKRGVRTTAIGLAIGLALAMAGAQLLSSLLFGVHPFDPLTYGAVAVILGLTSIAACIVPALRAMRVQPTVALRFE